MQQRQVQSVYVGQGCRLNVKQQAAATATAAAAACVGAN